MAGWLSLSGYLSYKPAGALGRLWSRRRQWYELDDSSSRLVFYKTKDDAESGSAALGSFALRDMTISVGTEEENQFVIMINDKEHHFTADNHESMMIWMVGLQAKRDSTLLRRKLPDRRPSIDLDRRSSLPLLTKAQGECSPKSVRVVSEVDNAVHYSLKRRHLSPSKSLLELSAKDNKTLKERRQILKALQNSTESSLEKVDETEWQWRPLVSQSYPLSSIGSRICSWPQSDDEDDDHDDSSDDDELDYLQSGKENVDDVFTIETSHGVNASSDGPARGKETTNGKNARRLSSLQSFDSSPLDGDSGVSEGSVSAQMLDVEHQFILVKCELADTLNREAMVKERLEEQCDLVADLRQQLIARELSQTSDKQTVDERLRDKMRVLSNQNQFLNEELKRLVQCKVQEQEKLEKQDESINSLKMEIEKWKSDYISIIQSSITVPTGDIVDGFEVKLYGGNRHKDRIKSLLEEAHATDPRMPVFARVARDSKHVDCYGFRQHHGSEGLLLHYCCQQLHRHYSSSAAVVHQLEGRWRKVLSCSRGKPLVRTRVLKTLCRQGVPSHLRHEVWRRLVYAQVKDLMHANGAHYFSHLVNKTFDSQFSSRYRKQISLDLLRTMPNNINFNCRSAEGIERMKTVLQAFCIHNRELGYCQGMNFLTGMCLLLLDTETTFWALVAITEKYFATNYFDQSLSGVQADQDVLKEMIDDRLPRLSAHFRAHDVDIATVTLSWFLAVFFDALPFETLLRVWDCFLLEGPKVLFRFSLALLKMNEDGLLEKTDTVSIMKHLKCCTKLVFDADGFVKMAFDDEKPFPRRRAIAAKQAVYLNLLKERLRRRELYGRVATDTEQIFHEPDLIPSSALVYECASICGPGVVWICYGEPQQGKVAVLNCELKDNVMHDAGIQLGTNIICTCTVENEIFLVGTLCWQLHAYSIKSRQELWTVQLHDSILSLAYWSDAQTNQLFVGLADGTIAVIQQVQPKCPSDEALYIPLGRSPVTALLLMDNRLWASSANIVHLLSIDTLDVVDKFVVSASPFDHVMSLVEGGGGAGVWLSVKGSSVVQLWDPSPLRCRLCFDIAANCYLQTHNLKVDDGTLNEHRITALLVSNSCLWLGTGDGNLVTYDITSCIANRVDADNSEQKGATAETSSVDESEKNGKCCEGMECGIGEGNGGEEREGDLTKVCGGTMRRRPDEDRGVVDGAPDVVPDTRRNDTTCVSTRDALERQHTGGACRTCETTDPKPETAPAGDQRLARSKSGEPIANVADRSHDASEDRRGTKKRSGKKWKRTRQRQKRSVLASAISTLPSRWVGELDRRGCTAQSDCPSSRSSQSRKSKKSFEYSTNWDISLPTATNHRETSLRSCVGGTRDKRVEEAENAFLAGALSHMRKKTVSPPEPSSATGHHCVYSAEPRRAPIAEFSFEEYHPDGDGTAPTSPGFCCVTLEPAAAAAAAGELAVPPAPAALLSPITEEDDGGRTAALRRQAARGVTDSGTTNGGGMEAGTTATNGVADEPVNRRLPEDSSSGACVPNKSRDVSSAMTHSDCPAGQRKDERAAGRKVDAWRQTRSQSLNVVSFSDVLLSEQQLSDSAATPHDQGRTETGDARSVSAGRGRTGETTSQSTRPPVRRDDSYEAAAGRRDSTASLDRVTIKLTLQAKVKTSDRPIRCLVETSCENEPIIISCAGCYGDDEAVLMWRRQSNEILWSNQPVLDICPLTNQPRRPSYMKLYSDRASSLSEHD